MKSGLQLPSYSGDRANKSVDILMSLRISNSHRSPLKVRERTLDAYSFVGMWQPRGEGAAPVALRRAFALPNAIAGSLTFFFTICLGLAPTAKSVAVIGADAEAGWVANYRAESRKIE